MNIYLYCGAENPHFLETAIHLQESLSKQGISCDFEGKNGPYDVMGAVGGDGTILDAANIAFKRDLPLFGVNAGRVGFLAAFDEKNIEDISEETINSLYLSERDVISVNVDGRPYRETAINDIVISREDVRKTIEVEICYNENKLGVYRCDGMIFSTATGSTAYNLAAGGPAILPEVSAMVMTPICATNAQRSVVVPMNTKIRLKMSQRPENAPIIVDGRVFTTIGKGESVTIEGDSGKLKLLLNHARDNYEILTGTRGGI